MFQGGIRNVSASLKKFNYRGHSPPLLENWGSTRGRVRGGQASLRNAIQRICKGLKPHNFIGFYRFSAAVQNIISFSFPQT